MGNVIYQVHANGFTKNRYHDRGSESIYVQYGYFKYTALFLILSHDHRSSSPSLLNSNVCDGLYTLSVLWRYFNVLWSNSAWAVKVTSWRLCTCLKARVAYWPIINWLRDYLLINCVALDLANIFDSPRVEFNIFKY